MSVSGQGKGDKPRGRTEPSKSSRTYTGLANPEEASRSQDRPRCALSRFCHGNRLVAFQQTRQKPLRIQPRPLDTRRHRVYKIEGFRRTNTPSTPSITPSPPDPQATIAMSSGVEQELPRAVVSNNTHFTVCRRAPPQVTGSTFTSRPFPWVPHEGGGPWFPVTCPLHPIWHMEYNGETTPPLPIRSFG